MQACFSALESTSVPSKSNSTTRIIDGSHGKRCRIALSSTVTTMSMAQVTLFHRASEVLTRGKETAMGLAQHEPAAATARFFAGMRAIRWARRERAIDARLWRFAHRVRDRQLVSKRRTAAQLLGDRAHRAPARP
jgi:hypothetical protein